MFAIALLALAGIANALTMHTPASLVQCQPIKLSWEAGVPPFYLSVVPGGQTAAAPLVTFPKMDASSQTWMVNLAPGTSVTVMVTDNTGETSATSPVTVMAGTNADCMNASSSSQAPVDTPAPSAEQTPAETPAVSSSAETPAASSAPVSSPAASAPVASSAPVSSAKPSSAAVSSSVSRSASSAVASPSATGASGAGRVAVGGAVAAAAGIVALAAF
ncbi:hypothetical protein CcaverHIS002_0203180 [Cutaneotrichosporon cavernicola]|uniref:Uncharacterized protein n=1 Tax=Cutaneotrichosporon cavernicola TaxID=279322 RepID=A0AA48L118_9TREE|nr:uncharacterized protein CcaverHIS019_0203170 [Cutaneotrichosporon cavernicola]BEI81158.1 hypothetical protein CcaverHIS002_0203180 [Cutaneotrichosporon cavernicola]BEI88955.1 hypothetical protein CcaverHIS019_0203170 [Cutaneotrichosporon cavernicola]BEI96732.1 hypothetical protein CcaverHIS631_0203210 [Cutaneotrichosporon cavernicola]BEJ04504.1 hypothetical protein CcaverHIS641_0203210 [Cutaneotrichosporon cavernicola]